MHGLYAEGMYLLVIGERHKIAQISSLKTQTPSMKCSSLTILFIQE